MATTKEILDAVTKAADWAIEFEPGDKSFRAALFLAYLAGRLAERAPALAAELDRVRTFGGAQSAQERLPAHQQPETGNGDR